jgi:hypothetical protein
MGEKLEPGIVDAVINANFKNIAEAGAFYSALSMRDAVESQRRFNEIGNISTGQLLKVMNEIDVSEANALVKANTGFDRASQSHDMGKIINELSSALANAQIMSKLAQTTRPETGAGG